MGAIVTLAGLNRAKMTGPRGRKEQIAITQEWTGHAVVGGLLPRQQ